MLNTLHMGYRIAYFYPLRVQLTTICVTAEKLFNTYVYRNLRLFFVLIQTSLIFCFFFYVKARFATIFYYYYFLGL